MLYKAFLSLLQSVKENKLMAICDNRTWKAFSELGKGMLWIQQKHSQHFSFSEAWAN